MPDDTNNTPNQGSSPQPVTPSQPEQYEQPEPLTPSSPSTLEDSEQIKADAANTSVVADEVEPTTSAQPTAPSNGISDAPVAATAAGDSQTSQYKAPKKGKKKLVIGGILALLIVLILGGSAFAYVMMRQSPQSILGGAIASLYDVKAVDGSFTYTSTESDSTSIKVKFNTKSHDNQYNMAADAEVKFDKTTINLKGDGAYDKDGNAYFKLDGIEKALKSYESFLPPEASTLVKKYDNKWVKISASDIQKQSKDAEKSQKCVKELSDKLSTPEFKRDVEQTYRAHQFIEVKNELPKQDGNVRYEITNNKTTAKEFSKAFKDTASFKSVSKDCRDLLSSDSSMSETADTKGVKVVTSISEWSHELKQLDVSSKEDGKDIKAVVNFDRSDNMNIQIPKDTIPFSELTKDFSSITGSTASEASTSDTMMTNES